jgi:3-hydroxyisobutyrate dehydrogenase-like beta-hydroxyacid dehydrogenase
MSSVKPEVSFIGMGAMGFGMATHLIKQGYQVTGFDAWGPTLEKFKAAGGTTATTAAEAAKGKNYSICMVATAQQAQSVLLDGHSPVVPALPQGATLLLCSSVPSGYVQGLEKHLQDIGRRDIYLIDSPVSGGAYRAAQGTLSIMAGASDEAISKGRFLLEELSDHDKLYIVKGGIGAGSNMKMVHQVLAANQILSASEAIGFAIYLGLDPQKTGDAVMNSDATSWMFEHRLPRILHPQFQPLVSALTIILKDTSIITSEARRYLFPVPMTSAAEQVYFAGVSRRYGPDDDSGMVRVYTEGKDNLGSVEGLVKGESEKTLLVQALLRGIHLCSAAESLAFSHYLKLDLDQVLELCVKAAGGSGILEKIGADIIKILRGGRPPQTTGGYGLEQIAKELQDAVDEAQRLQVPLFLGNQALNLIRLVQQHAPQEFRAQAGAASVVKQWAI